MFWILHWCVWEIKKLRNKIKDILAAIGFINTRITGISSGGGSGQQQVFKNAGDPNGNVTVSHTNPAICIDTTNGIIWSKTDGVASDTGWSTP